MRNPTIVGAIVLALSNASCDVLGPPPSPPDNPAAEGKLPALETPPFAELGRGRIAFERVAGDGSAFGGTYVIDGAAQRSYPVINYLNTPAAQPALSPDGKTLVFTSPINTVPACGSHLQVLDIDGSRTRCVGTYVADFAPSWTPDGRQIIVSVSDSLGTNIYRQDTSLTTSPILIRRFETTMDSAWTLDPPVSVSPSGRLLIAGMRRAVSSRAVTWKGILAMNADGSNLTRLYTLPDTFSRAFAPSWSPDGRRIAFIAGLVDSSATHYQWLTTVQVMNEDGTGRREVGAIPTFGADAFGWVNTFGEPVAVSLCWTSDGSHIVFSAPEEAENWHLFVASSDGSTLIVNPVTRAPGWQDTSVSCTP